MFSRRDKLLVLPWEQRRYENHLRKVQSALPTIDNRPPISRHHVAIKLKRKQKENERCNQIEKNNLILLQKLNSIMQKNRVDNCWNTPQPNFLSRVGIYTPIRSAETKQKTDREISGDLSLIDSNARLRKSKCLACTPQETQQNKIPEERIPWEPDKPPVRKPRSKSVPPQKTNLLPTAKQSRISSPKTLAETKTDNLAKKRSKSCKNLNQKKFVNSLNETLPQSIVLSRGSLVLSVNFPSDTFVKLQDGKSEKFIARGLCQCKKQEINC